MRVFKNKWFNRWAKKEGVTDAVLLRAAGEVATGKAEANLGGALFKKRLPRSGEGKRGGYRVIVGYKKPNSERIIFLYAFSKKDKANITTKEEAALNITAESFLLATDKQILDLLEKKIVLEVKEDE